MQALLRAAVRHPGTSVLDIISPCVTFNNAATSTKSYPYGKDHEIPLHEIQILAPDYGEERDEITIEDYDEGDIIDVEMHDGSFIRLKKLDNDHDPRNRRMAMEVLERSMREQIFSTGLLYYEEPRPTLADTEELVDTPLALLKETELRPPKEALDKVMQSLMVG